MSITVSGVGDAVGRPDQVEVDVGVSVLAGSVAEAASVAAEKAQAVTSALTSAGVAADDMATTEYSIRPEYDYSGSEQRLLGYRVSNIVRARLRDVSAVGPLVDSITSAGGDETRVNGLSFGVADETSVLAEAREAAWKDALAKATQLAELSGQSLGKATSIIETVKPPVAPMRMMAADMAMEKTTPIQPGTTAVGVTLQVQFEAGA
ncbi:MAG TPA: SIMPL domain-containing protein [Acidimicrobiia bacterium]|nr:SIMPL domain-containing protein [Acidimicrobiia bacterium]